MSEDDEMDEVIAGLRAQFRARLKVQAAAMRDALRVFDDAGAPEGRREAAKLLLANAHLLAGSAGSFGFAAIGEAASPVEEMVRSALAADGLVTPPQAFGPLVSDLLALCEQAGEDEDSPQKHGDPERNSKI
jgi:hypothetical protein